LLEVLGQPNVQVEHYSQPTVTPKIQEFKACAKEFYNRMATAESEELAEEAYSIGHMVSADSSDALSRAGRM
jgi:hypothetical protein